MLQPPQRSVVRTVVLISLALYGTTSFALGLGPLRLQSALGQRLNATVEMLGPEAKSMTENCIRTRLASPDGSDILQPQTEIRRLKGGRVEMALTSRQVIEEPAITLVIEVICSPELRRDYQLLLDLKDGLPRVLQQANAEPARPAPLPSVRQTAVAGDSSSPARGKRRSTVRAIPVAARADTDEPDVDALISRAVPKRVPSSTGSRNVLKLSQADISHVKKPGLKMSEALSASETAPAAAESEAISAAKARFLAMMRDEDPVALGLRQIRGLQSQLDARPPASATPAGASPAIMATGTPAVASGAVAVAPASQPAASPNPDAAGDGKLAGQPATEGKAPPRPQQSMLPRTPEFNKWLIGLALMLLASVAVLPILLKIVRRGSDGNHRPGGSSGSVTNGREAGLLEAARADATSKKNKIGMQEKKASDLVQDEDLALLRYVERFIEKKDEDRATSGTAAAAAQKMAGRTDASGLAEGSSASEAKPPRLPADPGKRPGATFELISDVMQEAEFWKMLNETQRAIDILENYCSADATVSSSPVPWLYLADLYIANGDLERHDQLREQFRIRFNGRIAAHADTGDVTARSLEDYPHLIHQISELWGNRTVVPFLQDLLINKRDDPREGFDLAVYREILLLIDVAREREATLA